MREGDVAAARAALTAAKYVAAGLPPRDASHIAFFDLVFAGRTDPAIAALYAHLTAWPRDALVLATAANPNGLIGASGRIGQKHHDAMALDRHSGGPQQRMSERRHSCGVPNSPGIRATPPPGVRCVTMPTAHCRDRAPGWPTCMSFWRRP